MSGRAAEGNAGVSGRRRPSKYRCRSHAESRMGSIQHAVGTRGPGRCRRHGPSFSDGGHKCRSPFQRKKEGYWRERGPRGRFHPYEPPREPSLHGQDAGGYNISARCARAPILDLTPESSAGDSSFTPATLLLIGGRVLGQSVEELATGSAARPVITGTTGDM